MNTMAQEFMAAVNEIVKMNAFTWSRHKFAVWSKNHYITNNLSGSFNAWVLDARILPAVDLVDAMRRKLIVKFEQRRKLAVTWKGKPVPYADNYVQDIGRNLGVE